MDRFYTIWSEEDQEYVGRCRDYEYMSVLDPDESKALEGIKQLVKEWDENERT